MSSPTGLFSTGTDKNYMDLMPVVSVCSMPERVTADKTDILQTFDQPVTCANVRADRLPVRVESTGLPIGISISEEIGV